jgi:hypothetical protein
VSVDTPSPGRDHILIIGPGKTGTTGLYTSVKSGLLQVNPAAHCFFEPHDHRPLDLVSMLDPGDPTLVKVTMDSWARAVPDPLVFERRVMTVRDPRDVLVSALLFRPLTVRAIGRATDRSVEEFVEALEAKEADPSSLSLRDLFDLAAKLEIGSPPYSGMLRDLGRQRDFLATYPTHVMKYERFVQADLSDLSEYLGFEVKNAVASDSAMFGHIARSQGFGEYLQWFRPDDLEYFNDYFGEMLEFFEFPTDVPLPATQRIEPDHGSQYVRSRYQARRTTLRQVAEQRAHDWTPEDVESIEALHRMADYGSNGDSSACVRVARVIMSGRLGPEAGDEVEALRWARTGAQLGSVAGMKLTTELLERLAGDNSELRREQRRWRSELALRRTKASPDDKARIAALERELDSVRKSTSMKVGTKLVEAARAPRRNGPKAAREMYAMWRQHRKGSRKRS